MTHEDIYTKFMIEYDKANVATSYSSLTKYEIATVLDKAYLALIAQKTTGSNFRKVGFEADVKSIEDMRPLVIRSVFSKSLDTEYVANNEYIYDIPNTVLYLIDGSIDVINNTQSSVNVISHILAQKYKESSNNLPWISNPVCYIENNHVHVLIDRLQYESNKGSLQLQFSYIRKPTSFVEMFNSSIKEEEKTFELNDSMAEELINLAIIMSLDITESSRLNSKVTISQLES